MTPRTVFSRNLSHTVVFTLLQLFLLVYSTATTMDPRRPIYVIGHMVNSIEEITQFLDRGANVLESDISFYDNGTVHRIYHGPFGDCGRDLLRSADLSEYLNYIREINNPVTGNYSGKLIFQFFDLKLTNLNKEAKLKAGKNLADHVLDNLWKDTTDGNRVRVLVYINHVADKETVVGFRDRFKERGAAEQLKDVGYDGGVDSSEDIEAMWKSIGVDANIWQGDGTINCFSALYPDIRLRQEVRIRDSKGYISKVYHWTIDHPKRMRKSLDLGVDGMITNVPEKLVEIVSEFAQTMRLANPNDNPFARFDS